MLIDLDRTALISKIMSNMVLQWILSCVNYPRKNMKTPKRAKAHKMTNKKKLSPPTSTAVKRLETLKKCIEVKCVTPHKKPSSCSNTTKVVNLTKNTFYPMSNCITYNT